MPYLSFDFDLLERLPEMSRAAGVAQGDLCLGCLLMWRYCWRERVEYVGPVHLDGFFGCHTDALIDALAEFRVVARGDDDLLRVKGADRYKRILEARQKGAGAANAKRRSSAEGARRERDVSDAPTTLKRRSHDAQASMPARSSVDPAALTDDLTASSEQRAANSEQQGDARTREGSTEPAPPPTGVRVRVHRGGEVREVAPTEGTGLPGTIDREWVEVLAEKGLAAVPDLSGAGIAEAHLRHLAPDKRLAVLRAFRDDAEDWVAKHRQLRFLDAGRVNGYLLAESARPASGTSGFDCSRIAELDEPPEPPPGWVPDAPPAPVRVARKAVPRG